VVNWNTGSVANQIHSLITVPSSISGAPLSNIINQQEIFIEGYLKTTIDSNAIEEKYQGPLVFLSISKVLSAKSVQGAENTFSIGEFSVNKGAASALSESADIYEKNAMRDLQELKNKYGFYKAFG